MENKGKLLPLSASLDDQNTAINTSLMGDRSLQNESRSYGVLDCSSPQTFLQSFLAACHQQGQKENL